MQDHEGEVHKVLEVKFDKVPKELRATYRLSDDQIESDRKQDDDQ